MSDETRQLWLHRLDQTVRAIAGAGVAVLAAMVAYVVLSRYAFGQTPRWSEELPRLILVWVTFLGVVSGFARNAHFDAGISHLLVSNQRVRRVLEVIARLASVAFLIVLAVTGWQITRFTWHHESTALSLPGGLFYLPLLVGAVLSLVALALKGGQK